MHKALLSASEVYQPTGTIDGQATIFSAACSAWRKGDRHLHCAPHWCTSPLLFGTLQDQMNMEVMQSPPVSDAFGMLLQGKVNGMHKNGDLQRHWTAFQSQEYNVVGVSHANQQPVKSIMLPLHLVHSIFWGWANPENGAMSRLSVQSSQLRRHVHSYVMCAACNRHSCNGSCVHAAPSCTFCR